MDTEEIFQVRRLLCIAALPKSEGEAKTAYNENCHCHSFVSCAHVGDR